MEAKKIFMENVPEQTGHNTYMQRVARLAIIDLYTTNPHSPWQNKAESLIDIIKGKAKRRRFHRNIPKKV